MVESKLVTIKELTTDNPTLCLSPLRVFEKCHQCPQYKTAVSHSLVDKLKCVPHVKAETLRVIERRKQLYAELAKLDRLITEG